VKNIGLWNLVWPAALVCIVSNIAAISIFSSSVSAEIFLGMAGPLLVAIVFTVTLSRVFRHNPERVTQLLIRGLVCKMVTFGVYVTTIVLTFELEAIAFAVSFTLYFVLLHILEVFYLQRLSMANQQSAG
jgi:cytochrome c biogenesis factor